MRHRRIMIFGTATTVGCGAGKGGGGCHRRPGAEAGAHRGTFAVPHEGSA